MVTIMITSWVPYGEEKKAANMYNETSIKFPENKSFEKVVLQLATRSTKEGFKVISIVEVKKGKFEESLDRLNRLMLAFTDIEGFKFEIETFQSAIDAIWLYLDDSVI